MTLSFVTTKDKLMTISAATIKETKSKYKKTSPVLFLEGQMYLHSCVYFLSHVTDLLKHTTIVRTHIFANII